MNFIHFWKTSSRAEKGTFVLVWLASIAMFAHAGMFIYFYKFHETPSVVWTNTTFPVVNQVIKRGDPIIFTIHQRCAKDNYRATTVREIIDGISYSIPSTTVQIQKGCVTDTRYVPEVSKALPPGEYYIRNIIQVEINWFYFNRVDTYHTQTEKFTIIDPRIDQQAATTSQ